MSVNSSVLAGTAIVAVMSVVIVGRVAVWFIRETARTKKVGLEHMHKLWPQATAIEAADAWAATDGATADQLRALGELVRPLRRPR
jgi:hypothetical protein